MMTTLKPMTTEGTMREAKEPARWASSAPGPRALFEYSQQIQSHDVGGRKVALAVTKSNPISGQAYRVQAQMIASSSNTRGYLGQLAQPQEHRKRSILREPLKHIAAENETVVWRRPKATTTESVTPAISHAVASFCQDLEETMRVSAEDDEPISPQTKERTHEVYRALTTRFTLLRKTPPERIMVGAGPDGSIDLVWSNGARKLFVNVSEDKEVAYFGMDKAQEQDVVRGTESSTEIGWLIDWLLSK